MLHTLAKYIEPIIFGLIFLLCIVELIRVRSAAEIWDETNKKYRVILIILPFILLAMIIMRLVWS